MFSYHVISRIIKPFIPAMIMQFSVCICVYVNKAAGEPIIPEERMRALSHERSAKRILFSASEKIAIIRYILCILVKEREERESENFCSNRYCYFIEIWNVSTISFALESEVWGGNSDYSNDFGGYVCIVPMMHAFSS